MLDQWNNFFVMVGGGAAALAGLIFVAISINPERIVQNATHKNRAINMLSGFSAIFGDVPAHVEKGERRCPP